MCAVNSGTSSAAPASTPRSGRRASFVSLRSDSGVASDQIAQLVGHSSTSTTETVYRHQIRPVIRPGAEVMDTLFRAPGE